MAGRKGSLMSVRTDLKVLDATIRDGGLCNNFNFSDEELSMLGAVLVRLYIESTVFKGAVS